jgi:hypothetical protein
VEALPAAAAGDLADRGGEDVERQADQRGLIACVVKRLDQAYFQAKGRLREPAVLRPRGILTRSAKNLHTCFFGYFGPELEPGACAWSVTGGAGSATKESFDVPIVHPAACREVEIV